MLGAHPVTSELIGSVVDVAPAPTTPAAEAHRTERLLITSDQSAQKSETQETQETHGSDVLPAASALTALSPQHRLFVEHYCGDAGFNATTAYELAGFVRNKHNAARLLNRDDIGAAVKERVDQLAHEARGPIMTGEQALERMTMFADGNIVEVLPEGHRLRSLPEPVQRRIRRIRDTKHGLDIEFHDAMHATETLAKADGKFVKRHEVRVTRTLADILAEANALEREQVSA